MQRIRRLAWVDSLYFATSHLLKLFSLDDWLILLISKAQKFLDGYFNARVKYAFKLTMAFPSIERGAFGILFNFG